MGERLKLATLALPSTFLLPTFLAALLLSAFAAGDGVFAWDVTFTRLVQRAPEAGVGTAVHQVNALGETASMMALGVGVVLVLLKWGRTGPALLLLAAMLARAANPALKTLFDSPRPTPDLVRVTEQSTGQGFPSAHVMGVVLFFGAVLWLARELVSRRGPRLAIQTAAGGMLLASGFGRIYVGAHWPTDVLGAYLWGGLLLAGLIIGRHVVTAWIESGSFRRATASPVYSISTLKIGTSDRLLTGVLPAGRGLRDTTSERGSSQRWLGAVRIGALLAVGLIVGLVGALAAA